MPNTPRGARRNQDTGTPLGAQHVDGAQSALLVGPSGWPLPLDIDETLQVHDTSVDPGQPITIAQTLRQIAFTESQMLQELRLLRNGRLKTDARIQEEAALWQAKITPSLLVPGITTQATAYTAADAVGFPFVIPNLGGPNRAVVIFDAIAIFDIVPTTTSGGVALLFFDGPVANGTDNGAVAISDIEAQRVVGGILIGAIGASALFANNAVSWAAVNGTSKSDRTFVTAEDGSLTCLAICNSAFTIAAGGNLFIKLLYRYANFQGVS